MRQQIPLKLIPPPAVGTRSVLVLNDPTKRTPIIKGPGAVNDVDFICANCAHVIVDGVRRDSIKNMVFKCPVCGMHNEIV